MEEQSVQAAGPELLKKDHEFVVPGDKLVSSMEYLPGRNCFRDGDSICSKRLGIVHVENRVISVIPLSGIYTPQVGDMVIGEVEDVQSNGWFIDLETPYSSYLSLSGVRGYVRQGTDLTKIYNVGDLIYVKIVSFNRQGISLSMQDDRARKLIGGKIITVEPVKVPRVIGRQGSMISTIKRKTGSNVIVGQNGVIWIQGGDENLSTIVIKMVEKDAQTEGLTEKIEKFLEENAPKIITPAMPPVQDEEPKNIFSDSPSEGGEY